MVDLIAAHGYWGNLKRDKVDNAKAKIKELEFKGYTMTVEDQKEIDNQKILIDDEQRDCNHSFRVHTIFTNIERICDHCDKIDREYDHFKSMGVSK